VEKNPKKQNQKVKLFINLNSVCYFQSIVVVTQSPIKKPFTLEKKLFISASMIMFEVDELFKTQTNHHLQPIIFLQKKTTKQICSFAQEQQLLITNPN
jgi:hypothetical protein